MRICSAILVAAAMLAVPSRAADGEWRELFDGRTLEGWTAGDGGPPGAGWKVEEGVLHRVGPAGDLISAGTFGDFELEFEWKVAAKSNSGVKYRVRKSPAGWLGPEYQVLDDAGHAKGKVARTSAAAIYDVLAPAADKVLKPVGQWNRSRIVASGKRIEHWLNGERVLAVTVGSAEWEQARQAGKFRKVGDFAGPGPGRILLQDHGDEVWFRAIRIREP